MIIAYDKSVRKRQQYNPADYEPLGDQQTPGQVQLIPQVQPQVPGVAPAQAQPVQAPAAAPVPVQVQPQAPAPIAPPAPAPAPVTGPTGYDQQLSQATAQRKQAANARYLAAGKPAPYPEAMPAGPAPWQGHKSAIPLDAPAAVSKSAESDNVIQRPEKLGAEIDKITAAGGVPKPQLLESYRKASKQAETRYAALSQEHQAAEVKKEAAEAEQDSEHKSRMDAFSAEQDEKKRVGLLKEVAVPQLSIASKAYNSKDYDRAIKVAQDMLDADKAGELPAGMTSRFSKIIDDSQDAKAAIEKEAKVQATTKAATAFAPKVKAAEKNLTQAETAITAEREKYNRLDSRYWTLRARDGDKDADVAAVWQQVQESDAKILRLTNARDAAQRAWESLKQEHSNLAAGVQAQPAPAAGTQAPAQVKNDADFDALPSGTPFIGPDGIPRRKP